MKGRAASVGAVQYAGIVAGIERFARAVLVDKEAREHGCGFHANRQGIFQLVEFGQPQQDRRKP